MLVFYSSVVGLFLRLWLLQMPHLLSWLETRPEITTPATSWQRCKCQVYFTEVLG